MFIVHISIDDIDNNTRKEEVSVKHYTKTIPNAPEDDRPLEVRSNLEYGKSTSKEHLYVSKHPVGEPLPTPIDDEPPYAILIFTYICFLILIIIGHIRDFFGKIFKPEEYADLIEKMDMLLGMMGLKVSTCVD